jgi:hypothetical protein
VNTPFQIRPGPMYQGSKPVRDPAYKRFIKRLPCVACGKTWWVDPCHTGPHALRQKSSDLDCIPLCRQHHAEFDQCQWKFANRYSLDIPALITMFQHFYTEKLKGRAA